MTTTGSPPRTGARRAGARGRAAAADAGRAAVELALGRRELSIAVVAIALYVYFLYTVVDFASTANLQTLGTFIAATAIIAAGQVFLMISGEIDLSVGQTFALAAFIVAWLAEDGVPILLAVADRARRVRADRAHQRRHHHRRRRVVVHHDARHVLLPQRADADALERPPGRHAGRRARTRSSSAAAPTRGSCGRSASRSRCSCVLMRTRWGLHTFAVGGNLLGSREAGINVRWVKTRNFMLASTLAGFAGHHRGGPHHVDRPAGRRLRTSCSRRSRPPSSAAPLLAGGSGTVDRRVHRRLRARHPARRLHAPGRQRLHVRPHPGPRDPRRDGGRHLRHAAAPPRRQGGAPDMAEVLRCRGHGQAVRPGHGAAQRRPAPRAGRGARPARRQRRRQVDADQDPLRLLQAGRRPDLHRRRAGRDQLGASTPARWGSTPSTRTSRWSTS